MTEEEKCFTCSCCKETFPCGRTDEEAHKEKEVLFSAVPIEKMVKVCDDCFEAVMAWNEHPGYVWNEEKHRPIKEKYIRLLND